MEGIALQKSCEIIGLQLLFAPICSVVGVHKPKELPKKKMQAVADLNVFFDNVIKGLDLTVKVKQGKNGIAHLLASLDESINAERAYRAINAVLPDDPERGKMLLNEMKMTCEEILEGKCPSDEKREKLHSFCRVVLTLLNREHFEHLRNPQNLWP